MSMFKAPTKWSGPPRSVVLLDDEVLILRAVSRALRAAGFNVTTFTEASEATAAIARDRPAVVVSDLHMPTECGARFLTSVADETPETVRILLSADPDFRPKIGAIGDARVHAVMSKAEMSRLARVVIDLLTCRESTPATDAEALHLAARLADSLARPAHEDAAHRERLDRGAERLAIALGMSSDEVLDARLGAVLHEIGQMTVPEHVFGRPGALTASERHEVARHPLTGARVLAEMPAFQRAATIVAAHHEHHDGRGYPQKLSGSAIIPGARVVAAVDTYDAITTGRHYRAARSHQEALEELEGQAGSQLDPDVVRAFVSIERAFVNG